MPIVFLVVFLDIVGFSIIIPIFVYYAMGLGASRELATALLAIYPAAMLVATNHIRLFPPARMGRQRTNDAGLSPAGWR